MDEVLQKTGMWDPGGGKKGPIRRPDTLRRLTAMITIFPERRAKLRESVALYLQHSYPEDSTRVLQKRSSELDLY